MEKEDYRAINNLGKLSAALDILGIVMCSYDKDSKMYNTAKECIKNVEAFTEELVADYNEKSKKQ